MSVPSEQFGQEWSHDLRVEAGKCSSCGNTATDVCHSCERAITAVRAARFDYIHANRVKYAYDFDFKEKFDDMLHTLNKDGSTGLGQFQNYKDIGSALGWDGFCFTNQTNVQVLRHIVLGRIKALLNGEETHPEDIKVFIKQEPHKAAKLQQGRYRLIAAMSLEDQMVDRLLFYDWTREMDDYLNVNSKVGW